MGTTPTGTPTSSNNSQTKELAKMRALFNTIRDYKDPKNRQLSMIFTKLPSKIVCNIFFSVLQTRLGIVLSYIVTGQEI